MFERKWQQLPRFQQTRGILRLLALWVSNAYQAGFKGAHKDPLIGMGTAPLDDPIFRSAIFEQLGGVKLEGAVTTDICGKKDSHAVRLDKEAVDTIKKARLHQKVATSIFFESNGGQSRNEATLPEIRLAVAEPDIDIGNIETVLETLSTTCYFLSAEKNRYRFSLSPNLNKLLADRRASVQPKKIEERVRAEVQKVLSDGKGVERVYFPDKSGQISDRPVLTLVIATPEQSASEKTTRDFVEAATKECGSSGRTYKSGLVWSVPDSLGSLRDEARKVLAWEDIADEVDDLRLDEVQKRQLSENVKKAQRDVREAVWRTYKNVMLLGKDNTWKTVDLGLVHSSAAPNIVDLILNRLRQDGDIEEAVSPNFLSRNWPPAFKEWNAARLFQLMPEPFREKFAARTWKAVELMTFRALVLLHLIPGFGLALMIGFLEGSWARANQKGLIKMHSPMRFSLSVMSLGLTPILALLWITAPVAISAVLLVLAVGALGIVSTRNLIVHSPTQF